MDTARFLNLIKTDFWLWGTLLAYPRDASPYCAVLDKIQAMTTPSTMHFLNLAVRCLEDDECYLETGTWRGGTFIGALLGNDKRGYAIDDDSMNNHDEDERPSRDVWAENVIEFGVADRAAYIEAPVPDVWNYGKLTDDHPVGVYLFDGDKSTAARALEGLYGVVPLLAKEAVIILDDANEMQVRLAAHKFLERHRNAVLLIDMPTPGNCWPGFWNGFQMIAWSGK